MIRLICCLVVVVLSGCSSLIRNESSGLWHEVKSIGVSSVDNSLNYHVRFVCESTIDKNRVIGMLNKNLGLIVHSNRGLEVSYFVNKSELLGLFVYISPTSTKITKTDSGRVVLNNFPYHVINKSRTLKQSKGGVELVLIEVIIP